MCWCTAIGPMHSAVSAWMPQRDGGCVRAWSTYRTDSAIHASYWISGWPRSDVGPAFLTPLLMQTSALRTVAVTIEKFSHAP